MPALVATDIFIQITWVGVVTARHTTEVETESRSTVNLDWDGVVGGTYNGRTRASDSRLLQQHRPDTQMLMFVNLALLARKILTIFPTPWVFHSSIRNGWAQTL